MIYVLEVRKIQNKCLFRPSKLGRRQPSNDRRVAQWRRIRSEAISRALWVKGQTGGVRAHVEWKAVSWRGLTKKQSFDN